MRVLVTGAAGLVGSRAAGLAVQRGHDVHGTFHAGRIEGPWAWHALDSAEPGAAAGLLDRVRPEVVLDCAAWTDVDACEAEPARCERVNARGPALLAEAAALARARVVHVGTDFVFDGTARRPYVERDAPNPQSAYARAKLAAEHAVLGHAGNAVLRSAVVFGRHARKLSFPAWVVRELRAGKEVRVVEDQWCTPTLASSLAEALLAAAERGARGLLHTAGATCVTRAAFAEATARAFGLDPGSVVPIASSELRQRAPRPAYACLDSRQAAATIGWRALPLVEALQRFQAEATSDAGNASGEP